MTREELRHKITHTCHATNVDAISPRAAAQEIMALLDRYERERGSGVEAEAAWFLYQLITETMILRGSYARQAMDIATRWKEETERRELPPGPGEGE